MELVEASNTHTWLKSGLHYYVGFLLRFVAFDRQGNAVSVFDRFVGTRVYSAAWSPQNFVMRT